MKNNISDKTLIKILIVMTIFFSVFIVTYQLYERTHLKVPEMLVVVDGSEMSIPESFKTKIETGVLKIDINNAVQEELEQIPHIGEVIAARIIEYREKNGNFEKIEDIINVKGIGKKTFYKIKEFIYVWNEFSSTKCTIISYIFVFICHICK